MGFPIRFIQVFTALLIILAVPSFAAPDLLKQAHDARKAGRLGEARRQFATLAGNKKVPLEKRQEAGYWMAFCSVALKTPEQAVKDFLWFLSAFGKKNQAFVPDALHVLGRTYEFLGQPREAATMYQRCIEHPTAGKEFVAKSRKGMERLQEMLAEEKKHGNVRRPRIARESSKFDPYSRKPLSQEQFTRIKSFTERLTRREPLDSAMSVLMKEDHNLPMVLRLTEMYARHLEFEKEEAAKKILRRD
jgi:hypothetical protein